MTIAALQHTYPRHDFVWVSRNMRIVRSAKRMHKLKRRGVPMIHLGYGDGTTAQQRVGPGVYGPGTRTALGPWAWFVEEANPTHNMRLFSKRRRQAQARTVALYYNAGPADNGEPTGISEHVLPTVSPEEDAAARMYFLPRCD